MLYVFLLVALIFPAIAFAQTEVVAGSVDVESVDALTNLLIEAVRSEQWLVVAGVATTLVILMVRKAGLLSQVPVKYMPWVATGVAVVSSVGTSLVSGVSLVSAVTQGVLVGTAASGFWEMIFKHVSLTALKSEKSE
jgi:hypothetical protein